MGALRLLLATPLAQSHPPHRHRHQLLTVTPTTSLSVSSFVGRKRVSRTKAVGGDSSGPYQGVYGDWTVEESDVREVLAYRAGLVTAAASFVAAAALTNQDDVLLDALYAVGACGLGVSLLLIHIYVSQIKRTLQAFWGLGVTGSLLAYTTLAAPSGHGLVHFVLHNPTAVWLVGPLFAALTGLVFKEGLCYGKLEAALLTFVIPTLLLGHLSGLMDDGVKLILLRSWMLLFVVFAARKFSQPIKDDIGDKSVFIFNSLPDDEKQALIQKLQNQKLNQLQDNID